MNRASSTVAKESPIGAKVSDSVRPALVHENTSRTPFLHEFIQRLQATSGNRGAGLWIQAKLTVGATNSPYEREADQVAEQIMRMSSPAIVQRRCSDCDQEEEALRKCSSCEEEEDRTIQRKEAGLPEGPTSSIHEVLESPGHSLDLQTRGFMEHRFGADFSGIRIHNDASAAESARAINAAAYTMGNAIVFGAGRYMPEEDSGRRLLAHELVHVVQQRQGARPLIRRSHLLDFKDKDESHDPAKLPDTQIAATDEFKSLMDSNLIWQWKDHVTKEEALLACRLMLRQLREGKRVIWDSEARDFILSARRQLSTAGAAEKLVGKLEWVPLSVGEFTAPQTAHSEFMKWVLAAGPEPTDTSKMNCFEMILFASHQAGFLSREKLEKLYKEAATKTTPADIAAIIEGGLCKGAIQTFKPSDPKSPEPLPGDIIIFDIVANHAALSLGTKDPVNGEHQVVSNWIPPGFSHQVKKTTIETLLPHTGLTEVRFCGAAW